MATSDASQLSKLPGVDVSRAELDRIARRADIRRQLKSEFNRIHLNPYRFVYNVHISDPAVERFMAAHKSRYDYWKPTWKQFAFFFGVQVLPIILFAKYLGNRRSEQELKYRSGAIPYRDREDKYTTVSGQI